MQGTSLFDPLYEVEEQAPPSLEDIQEQLSDFDGSGSGLMSERQCLSACQSIEHLGFSKTELQAYVKEGLDVAGDGSGKKIKLAQFASYLAFEAKKKYNKSKNKNDEYSNPFADFLGGDGETKSKSPKGMKITLTHPMGKENTNGNVDKVDMTNSYSPTEANDDLPNWFGHSINTITTHPNEPTADPFAIFDDDSKMNNSQAMKPPKNHQAMHISIASEDILFNDDFDEVNTKPNLSPTKAASMKNVRNGMKHTKYASTQGLIAPPRSKGDKIVSKKRKSKTSSKHAASVSASFSFADHFSTEKVKLDPDATISEAAQFKAVSRAKSHNDIEVEPTPEKANNKNAKTTKKGKKKRDKVDAIKEMKRGAAMLKYGRRGFPHFRRFQISRDLTKLLWYSRKKPLSDTHVSIREMKDILTGQQTEVFKQCTQKTLEKASFSIIYGTKLKSLDVVAKSAEEAQLWIKGLKGLMKANGQGKLHKVVQILVDVDFKDISKTKYRQCSDDERRKYEGQHQNRPELVTTIQTTLEQSRKVFASLTKMEQIPNVQRSSEWDNVSELTSEIEQRLEEIEYGLINKTADLTDLKRDVWVLKVDVTVLEEKVKVLSKIKTIHPI